MKLDAQNYTEDTKVQDASVIFQSIFQKCVSFTGIKLLSLKQLVNDTSKFRPALKRFLLTNSYYTIEEYYSWK